MHKDQLAVTKNCEYIKVPRLNDDILKNINCYYKRNVAVDLLTVNCEAMIIWCIYPM